MTTTALVPVFTDAEGNTRCNARDLHAVLDVGRDFATWIKERIEQYGFADGEDYKLDSPKRGNQKSHGGDRRSRDYHLTLDMAKELAMVENNERGRQVRRYFIQIEKEARAKICSGGAARLQALPPKRRIRSRDDLSFTARDSEGRLINWTIPHDRNELWGPRYEIGQGYVDNELAELAAFDEREAYYAIASALSGSHEFRRGKETHFGNTGWGQECGFAEAVARAAIDGLRARLSGAAAFDPKTKKPPNGSAPFALPAPMKELSKGEREAINKKAWADTAKCSQECFSKRRAEMLKTAH